MTTDPIRDKKQLKALAGYWLKRRNFRNYALIVLGFYTALRIGDLLRLRWADVYDFDTGAFRTHIAITEKKTGKQRMIVLHDKAAHALRLWLETPSRRGDYIFSNNRKKAAAISRIQAWRVITEAAKAIKAVGRIACHSLRKSFGYIAYKSGVSSVMLMFIFKHSCFEITKVYLGITQEEQDQVFLSMDVF